MKIKLVKRNKLENTLLDKTINREIFKKLYNGIQDTIKIY